MGLNLSREGRKHRRGLGRRKQRHQKKGAGGIKVSMPLRTGRKEMNERKVMAVLRD